MKSWVIVPALMLSATVWSQSCLVPLEKSAPDARFSIDTNDNEIAIDLRTGLTWQRCAVGFELIDSNTPGEPDFCQLLDLDLDGVPDIQDDDVNNDVEVSHSWYEAIEYADEYAQTVAGTGWRMPNLKELASLIEHACFSPAINLQIFPNAAQADHWSSTPDVVNDSSAWRVNFSSGSDSSAAKNTNGYVYLVRDPD